MPEGSININLGGVSWERIVPSTFFCILPTSFCFDWCYTSSTSSGSTSCLSPLVTTVLPVVLRSVAWALWVTMRAGSQCQLAQHICNWQVLTRGKQRADARDWGAWLVGPEKVLSMQVHILARVFRGIKCSFFFFSLLHHGVEFSAPKEKIFTTTNTLFLVHFHH